MKDNRIVVSWQYIFIGLLILAFLCGYHTRRAKPLRSWFDRARAVTIKEDGVYLLGSGNVSMPGTLGVGSHTVGLHQIHVDCDTPEIMHSAVLLRVNGQWKWVGR